MRNEFHSIYSRSFGSLTDALTALQTSGFRDRALASVEERICRMLFDEGMKQVSPIELELIKIIPCERHYTVEMRYACSAKD